MRKRIFAPLLALALLLGTAGCGEAGSEVLASFRTLDVVGTRQYSVIYRKDDKLAVTVDAVVGRLGETGQLSSISTRYLGRDAIELRGGLVLPSPEVTETEPPEEDRDGERAAPAGDASGAEAAAPAPAAPEPFSRTLIVGVEQDFDPMAFEENGILRGMSVDIAAAIGGELDCRVAYQQISPAQVESQLASGNIDCALGFDPRTVDTERFSVGYTYMESEIVLASRRGSEVTGISDIEGRRIGTVDDPSVTAAISADERITRYASGATVYLSPRRCVNALDKGWCAAIVMDIIMLEHAL